MMRIRDLSRGLVATCLLELSVCVAGARAQPLAGDVEVMVRSNEANPIRLGADTVPELETVVLSRLRAEVGTQAHRLSLRFDGYVVAEHATTDGPARWGAEVSEAYASYAWSGCSAWLGIRRYPDQYAYLWKMLGK